MYVVFLVRMTGLKTITHVSYAGKMLVPISKSKLVKDAGTAMVIVIDCYSCSYSLQFTVAVAVAGTRKRARTRTVTITNERL